LIDIASVRGAVSISFYATTPFMGLHNPLAKQPASYVKKKEYTFKETLGEGTFGVVRSAVWNAADPPIGVAIKVISKKILKGHNEIVQGEMDVLKVGVLIGCITKSPH